jgi:acetylornithine deacetylase/succinyl-diaminopimelate desuccinylase-like protein
MKSSLLFVLLSLFFTSNVWAESNCKQQLLHIYQSQKSELELNDEYQQVFIKCLSEYVKIKTISPQGDEHLAVEFFAAIFSELRIPFKIYKTPSLVSNQVGQYKSNLIATIPYNFSENYDWKLGLSKKSIIMSHHMDVVNAVAGQWINPNFPFGAHIAPDSSGEMYLWGRGTLDMKGIGIAQMLSMLRILRKKIPRQHDLHFLALADEEEAASGALGTLQKMRAGEELFALTKARVFLNEGGGGIANTPVDGVNLNVISVEQKGGAWIKLEHNNVDYLLNRLSRLTLLDVDTQIHRKFRLSQKLNCQLVRILGPEAKPNVIVSQIALSLACEQKNQSASDIVAHLKTNFSQSMPQDATLMVEYKQDLFHINIQSKSSSHGSVGMSLSALDIMALVLYRLDLYQPSKKILKPAFYKMHKTHATQEFIDVLKNYDPALKFASKLSFIPFIRNMILKGIEDSFGIDGLFRTSCQFTNLNFQAGKAEAIIDCRLLHTAFALGMDDNHAQTFLKSLNRPRYLGNEIKLSLISGWNYTQSAHTTDEYAAIVRSIERTDAKTVVAPYLNPAGSDDAWFRNPKAAGIDGVEPLLCFGVFPANFSQDLIATMHGSNERFPLSQALAAQERYFDMIQELDQLK